MSVLRNYPAPFKACIPLSLDEFFATFDECWSRASSSFDKIEVCPVFVEDDDESFALFRDGDTTAAAELVRDRVRAQRSMYKALLDKGATITRYRVVGRPITPYIRDYEGPAYEAAASIGERVIFIDEASIPEGIQPVCRDMLVFDRRELLIHAYTPWGRLLGGYHTADAAAVEQAVALLDALAPLGMVGPA